MYLDILKITMYKNFNKYLCGWRQNMDEHVKCFVNHFVYDIYNIIVVTLQFIVP